MPEVLQLKISLKEIKPKIWRRFLVEDSITFQKLHEIIQDVMGWENYHLFEFKFENIRIIPPNEDYLEENELDPKKVKVKEYVNKEKQKFEYIYDFGDSWEHEVIVEKILDKNNSKQYSVCIAGERACPPEDCGGVWGYEELLEIRKNKNHPEYKDKIVNWLGEDFDPEEFDLNRINIKLNRYKR